MFICTSCGKECKKYARDMCRSCYERWLRNNNLEFRKRQNGNTKQWYKEHPEAREKYSERRKTDPQLRERDYHIKRQNRLRKLGMTENDYDKLLIFQNNCCAICGRNFNDVGAIHLDHNHKNNKPRGMLCSRCNNGLGMFEDDINMFSKVIKYLQHPIYLDFINQQSEED